MSEVVLKQSACYLSTPEHVRSFFGRFVYIYTGKGQLILTAAALRFVEAIGPVVEIPLDSIVEISIGRYSRFAKPLGLDYLSIRHQARGQEQTTLLTPTRSWTTPTWQTNKIVADWLDALRTAALKHSQPMES